MSTDLISDSQASFSSNREENNDQSQYKRIWDGPSGKKQYIETNDK